MGLVLAVLIPIAVVGFGLSMLGRTLNGAAAAVERSTARRAAGGPTMSAGGWLFVGIIVLGGAVLLIAH
jgi:hypothetical protein